MTELILSEKPLIRLIHGDCMAFMCGCNAEQYDLVVVDPPYGMPKDSTHGRGKLKNRMLNNGSVELWDIKPGADYFTELFRVSKNQIIWGGNYFDLPGSRVFVIWDKEQPFENFSAAEFAWMSFQTVSKIYKLPVTRTGDEMKIHPTQKPVALYKWILSKYANPGDTILDTHGGSMSSVIAAHDMGFDITCIELDKDYFDAAAARIKRYLSEPKIDFTAPSQDGEQIAIF